MGNQTAERTRHEESVRSITGREVVASFGPRYSDAQHAVDTLAERGFPVDRLSIVGHGLNFVEQVTGRRGYGSAALSGAASGAAIGALFGFIAGLFNWIDPLVSALALALYGVVVGAIVGGLIGLLMRAVDRTDYSSFGSMQASHFDVVADSEVADEARRKLRLGAAHDGGRR